MNSKLKRKYTKHEYRTARMAVRMYLLTGEQRQNGWLHSRDYGVYTYVMARQPESDTVSWAHRVDSTGRLHRVSKEKLLRFDTTELAVQSLDSRAAYSNSN